MTRAPTRFVLIRHAESEWNVAGRWQGHGDPGLSVRGVAQAETLARGLAGERADTLWTSDLRRARETAAILGRALALEPLCDARLRELDVGRWAGLTRTQILAADAEALARFEAGDPAECAGGAESRADIRRRVRGLFRELCARHPGQRLVVVTHLGVMRALLPGSEIANAAAVRVAGEDLVLEDPV